MEHLSNQHNDPTEPLSKWGDINLAELPDYLRMFVPSRLMVFAKRELEQFFRVDDLTLREEIELRDSLQTALKLYIANQKVIDRGEVPASRQISPVQEAVLIWLEKAYDGDVFEHPITEIYLNGSYFGDNMRIWRNFVGSLRAQRYADRHP